MKRVYYEIPSCSDYYIQYEDSGKFTIWYNECSIGGNNGAPFKTLVEAKIYVSNDAKRRLEIKLQNLNNELGQIKHVLGIVDEDHDWIEDYREKK